MAPPTSNNWGFINDPEFDKLAAAVRVAFDPAARDKALAALHERSVDEAAFLWVAHDVGPRAMTPEDQELRAAEELVRRLLDDDDELSSTLPVILRTRAQARVRRPTVRRERLSGVLSGTWVATRSALVAPCTA